MPTQRIIQTDLAPAPAGAYNQAKQIGPFLQISGQLAIDPSNGGVLKAGIREQTRQSLSQIGALLKHSGASWSDVLTVRAYLAQDKDFDEFDTTYAEVVSKPFPARTTVGAELAPGALVEIDVLAVIQD